MFSFILLIFSLKGFQPHVHQANIFNYPHYENFISLQILFFRMLKALFHFLLIIFKFINY
ncbi:hypothetical protein C6353_30085 [Bacillus toyonensis]|nr:hypothetical protein C6353_30085 [Bacillus toyonensis]